MRIDRFDQLEIEFAQQLAIAVDLFQHGVEQQRFTAGTACQQIAVCPGDAVEQLAEYHDCLAAELKNVIILKMRSERYSSIAVTACRVCH